MKTVTLENEKLRVTARVLGGDLVSIYGKETDCEYLWQGDPKYWAGQAPSMFPICGRLKDGKYTYAGKEYEMILHGFVKVSTLTVEEESPCRAVFLLTDNEETRASYPFSFVYRIIYTLDDNRLTVTYRVENTDDKELIFALGGHPAFNLPLEKGAADDSYYIEFASGLSPERMNIAPSCLFVDSYSPYSLSDGKYIRFSHSLFDNDAIFLRNAGSHVTLRSSVSERAVRVDFADFTHVGFWHMPKTDAPYVCIEPWDSVPALDDVPTVLETKPQMSRLAAGKTAEKSFTISLF